MIQLHSPLQRPFSDIQYIGVAICGSQQQRHVGILFRTNKNENPRILHLPFHNRLVCESPDHSYYWTHCSGFSDDEQLQLAVWFDRVWAVNGSRVPYGIAYSSTGHFDPITGTFVPSDQNCGLTCATFVMALFEDFAFPVLDAASWQPRDNDAEWQRQIVDALQSDMNKHPTLYTATHLADQIKNIGIAVRYRPEEVAASANISATPPLMFENAVPFGKEVLVQMGLE